MDELLLEQRMAERIVRLANVAKTPELEKLLVRLLESAKEGHLCLELEEIPELPLALCSLGEEGTPFLRTPLVLQKNRLYIQRNWALESLLVEKAVELSQRIPSSPEILLPIQEQLELKQTEAIAKAARQSFSIFVGGPGTGKTYTAGWFVRLLANTHWTRTFKTMIAAPTGKAAAHLESALVAQGPLPKNLECTSMTLHRLLRIRPGNQNFFSERKIDADLIVVDEASMLDSSLMLHLLNAIGPDTQLLLLGDPDQLPPIEAGSLFSEMAELFGSRLERSLRMGEPALISLAQAILQGDVKPVLEAASGSAFDSQEQLLFELCKWFPSPIHSVKPDPMACLQEHQGLRILSVLRQGPFGVDALNRELVKRFERQLRPSDWLAIPILISQNDPKQELYNGTMGVLIRQGFAGQATAYFSMAEGIRAISEGALPHYEWAICLSVHKSQGSEFEEVLVLFPPGSERFGRAALYTAVTRAKRKATLLGNSSTFAAGLAAPIRKRSGFTERFLKFKRGAH